MRHLQHNKFPFHYADILYQKPLKSINNNYITCSLFYKKYKKKYLKAIFILNL